MRATHSLKVSWLPGLLLLSGCDQPWPEPPPVDPAAFEAEHTVFREQRRRDLAFWAKHAGLWAVPAGLTSFGTDSTLPIVVPGPPPLRRLGSLQRVGDTVSLLPAGPGLLRDYEGHALDTALLLHPGPPDRLFRFASFEFWVDLQGTHPFLRAMDTTHLARAALVLPPEYPLDTRWRVAARFARYRRPRSEAVVDVTGDYQTLQASGVLRFRISGQEFHLQPFVDTDDPSSLWLMFQDSTNRDLTYQAGRYLWAPRPDSTGWTVLDFNTAINPPCAFTPFSICPPTPGKSPQRRDPGWRASPRGAVF